MAKLGWAFDDLLQETLDMSIHAARLEAAFRSGGTSSTVIHRAALTQALQVRANARAVLDFGAGIGGFCTAIRSAFPESTISAADITPRPTTLADDVHWCSADLNDVSDLPNAEFDLAFAIEVIEHLENPRHVLRELYRLLRPGGALILTTPNTGSIRSLLQITARGHFAQFDDANYPAHITPVTPLDLSRIAGEVGFVSCEIFFTDSGDLPKLLKWKWQQVPVIGRLFRGRLFSDNYGAVLRKGDKHAA